MPATTWAPHIEAQLVMPGSLDNLLQRPVLLSVKMDQPTEVSQVLRQLQLF
jgi:hypothetical protein